jgi:WD40 repeat protein
VAFSPDGKHLVTGALGAHTLRVYSVETGKLVKQVQNANSIRVVTFSPDGKLLATCHGTGSTYGEGSIQVWDTTTWTAKASLTGHAKLVLGMSFAADSRHLSSASNDGTMKLWDIQATRANPAGLMAVRKP